MTARLVFLFAGQGSQYPGMAARLYREEPRFTAALDRFDDLVVGLTGRSVLPVLLERGAVADFERVQDTHPAIVVVQLALVETLAERGLRPDAVLGLSLGEVAAATTAGALTPEEAVRHAVRQGALLAEACPPGGMVVVVRPTPSLAECLPPGCELAFASRSQAVVAGLEEPLRVLADRLHATGTTCYRMPVAVGFHSAAVDAATGPDGCPDRARATLPPTRPLTLPLGSCLLGKATGTLTRDHLWRSVRSSIRFPGALASLLADGPAALVDLGPGGSMSALAADCRQPGMLACVPAVAPGVDGRSRIDELVTRFG